MLPLQLKYNQTKTTSSTIGSVYFNLYWNYNINLLVPPPLIRNIGRQIYIRII